MLQPIKAAEALDAWVAALADLQAHALVVRPAARHRGRVGLLKADLVEGDVDGRGGSALVRAPMATDLVDESSSAAAYATAEASISLHDAPEAFNAFISVGEQSSELPVETMPVLYPSAAMRLGVAMKP